MKLRRVASAVTLAVLAACTQHAGTTSQSTPAPVPTNATGFPLYGGSELLAARDWQETVSADVAQHAQGVFGEGAGKYVGHETIAKTPASMPELEAWLRDVQKTPPAGYTVVVSGNRADEARGRARQIGIDFAAFKHDVNGRRRNVVVVALDPTTIDTKAGPMLGLIGKYKMLPQGLRDPIDEQAKRQTGFTISEALSTDTPIGAALDAFDRLRATGQRGIVVLDAGKL